MRGKRRPGRGDADSDTFGHTDGDAFSNADGYSDRNTDRNTDGNAGRQAFRISGSYWDVCSDSRANRERRCITDGNGSSDDIACAFGYTGRRTGGSAKDSGKARNVENL